MHDQIEAYLGALERNEYYRVDEVLRSTYYETTELVFFVGQNGAESGPFIRKRLKRDAGLGTAYERLWEAQQRGARFVHLPHIQECYSTESEHVVVMEFIRGETLSDLIYRRDPSSQLAFEILPLLCEAVEELHSRFDPPIIHRDLKPSNVMVSEGGVTLIDFGIARSVRDDRASDTVKFGTKGYAPPEQFGFGQTSIRSDIYALGMILHYCLTEEDPATFDRDGLSRDERIPTSLRTVILKATEFDPARRYESAAQMREALLEAESEKGEREVPIIEDSAASPPEGPPWMPTAPSRVTAAPASAVQRSQGRPGTFASPSSPPPSMGRRSFGALIPYGVGLGWDALLLILWLFFVIVVVSMILEPAETFREYAIPGRWIFGLGVIAVAPLPLMYAVADKRLLKERLPSLARFKWWAEIPICFCASFAIICLSALLSQLFLG